MHIVQILVPVADNRGRPFSSELLRAIQNELTERFGGLTAYTRAPAQGVWLAADKPARDDIVVVEVMVEELNRTWWGDFRRRLEQMLSQEQLVVRAFPIERL